MDFKGFVDMLKPMSCVLSIRKLSDGTYGDIRIVTGNSSYINATTYYQEMGNDDIFTSEFVPNSPYERYIPKDLNFEDFVYRAAIKGEKLHTYTHPERFAFWINLSMIPLVSEGDDIGYCVYSQELTKEADTEMMTNIAPEISNSVLSTCIKLNGTEDFKKSMDEVIVDIDKICGADHCCILLTEQSTRKCTVLCETFNPGSNRVSMNEYLDDNFYDITETWKDTLAGSTSIIVKDKQEWEVLKERNPLWYGSLTAAGVKSVVLLPLRSGTEILGYIWALDFDVERTVTIKETLELTAFFISAHIANHLLIKRMETISSMDLLTGIFNRNAMNNRIFHICEGKKEIPDYVGIVFVDLNGLKRMNDNQGHFAGDMLLKNAALVLQKEFENCEIYRAGGDEFMIIAPDMPEDEFDEHVEKLRKATESPDGVCFAVGKCYERSADIRKAMRTADERMYADKQKFYERHPEIAR